MNMSLPPNWNEMSLDALWEALNDPRRFAGGEQKNADANQGAGKRENNERN